MPEYRVGPMCDRGCAAGVDYLGLIYDGLNFVGIDEAGQIAIGQQRPWQLVAALLRRNL